MDARVTYKDNHLFGLFSYIDLRRRRKNKTDYHWDKFRVGRGRRRSAQTSSIIIIYNIYKYIHRYLCVHIRTKIMWSVSEIKILRQIRRTCNYILLCINIYIYSNNKCVRRAIECEWVLYRYLYYNACVVVFFRRRCHRCSLTRGGVCLSTVIDRMGTPGERKKQNTLQSDRNRRDSYIII